ncbi:3-alpha,7-alpha,12-alpha-trihydroxy-5-beta-cholest-24-enoyl-CoA hydratase [Aromatoleum toluvorans]|uniref:3-alpha,7-alpha, 12-alpha-trihydroxy-5-beta-cholest-24-enoyl-CoA hydratase n=1 Tax=Aromatoleum toluvorans TaxID=92002 RepID=A0ABX1PUA5_9RHOO|nr:MaoC/PaaZ C-terminal domain-containing protein [Aromatoleum toluvorans]NMG42262.1 3-alpha,7-alpha,12-alpha-trihydroxy-5-beta-cholest-24-enoyl-CoA hydratase [Aromatoleum toluvorans]
MNVDRLLAWPFQDVVQTYTVRDTLLYALSVGFGGDPTDAGQLRYVFEKDLMVVPSMAVVLGHPGPYVTDPAAGIDFRKIVYGEQALKLLRPLPTAATVRARERVVAILDKGRDKGTLLRTERHIVDDATGEPLAVLNATLMCRGDGGNGASHGEAGPVHAVPEGEPHRTTELATLPQAALLYRLNGDTNPLHADPELARRAGFERPILHGLCSYGLAVHALLKTWCDYDATRIASVRARFSAPVYPGETLVFESWRDGQTLSFRARSKERGVKVLDNGCALLR